jgi:hypothetical protein
LLSRVAVSGSPPRVGSYRRIERAGVCRRPPCACAPSCSLAADDRLNRRLVETELNQGFRVLVLTDHIENGRVLGADAKEQLVIVDSLLDVDESVAHRLIAAGRDRLVDQRESAAKEASRTASPKVRVEARRRLSICACMLVNNFCCPYNSWAISAFVSGASC